MFNFFRNNNKKITFIFGVPRSGTTWLWSLLESNSYIKPFLISVEKDECGFYEISETAVYKKYKKPKKIIQKFANLNSQYRIVEKTPYHTLLHDKILKDFPHSKNVLILRHPCSIVNSMVKSKMQAFKDYNIEKATNEIKLYYKKIKSLVKHSNVIVISYEALIDDTKNNLKKIFDYLEVDANNIDDIIESNKKMTKVKVEGAFRKGEKDSYKQDLSENEIKTIKELLVKEINYYNSFIS